MTRREQKRSFVSDIILGLLIALTVIYLIERIKQQLPHRFGDDIYLLVFIGILVGIVVMIAFPVLRQYYVRKTLNQKVQAKIEQQMSNLVRRRSQLVWNDAYGKPQLEKWIKEIDYFITHHIRPSLTQRERLMLGREHVIIANLIDARVESEIKAKPVCKAFSDDMTPVEFEIFCAEELRNTGWNVRVTKKSHDQGVDVVAEKDGMRVVIQCKLYSQPVGNKAVQEVVAAKAYEQAYYGVVVTNNSYTSTAEQLAAINGIRLLHYSDLQNLHNLLSR